MRQIPDGFTQTEIEYTDVFGDRVTETALVGTICKNGLELDVYIRKLQSGTKAVLAYGGDAVGKWFAETVVSRELITPAFKVRADVVEYLKLNFGYIVRSVSDKPTVEPTKPVLHYAVNGEKPAFNKMGRSHRLIIRSVSGYLAEGYAIRVTRAGGSDDAVYYNLHGGIIRDVKFFIDLSEVE